MSVYVTFKDKAIEYATQAVNEDKANNHETALMLYLRALEYFRTYLKYEKNEKLAIAIKEKVGMETVRANIYLGLA